MHCCSGYVVKFNIPLEQTGQRGLRGNISNFKILYELSVIKTSIFLYIRVFMYTIAFSLWTGDVKGKADLVS